MIDFALTKCEFLTILICCSDKEVISAEKRKFWIAETYKQNRNIEIQTFLYLESELPNTSVSSLEVSKIWSEQFKRLFPTHKILVTSEEYGKHVASCMGIQHIPFDIEKKFIPISASTIRRDIITNWEFLPDSVRPDYALKVVLLGTESTGKTTLTERLATHFCCTQVHEAGRDLIPDSKSFEFEDLTLVSSEHAARINEAAIGESPLIIIDTDVHITKSYAEFIFGKKLDVTKTVYDSSKAALYLYLNNDVPYIQDGTRLDEAERNNLDLSHRSVLKQHNIEIAEIRGNWEQRFRQCVDLISELLIDHKESPHNLILEPIQGSIAWGSGLK